MKIRLLLKHNLSLKSLAYYEMAALIRIQFSKNSCWLTQFENMKTEPSKKKKRKEKRVKKIRNIRDDECIFYENWTNHFCMTWNSTLSNTNSLCDRNNQSLLLLKRMQLSFARKSICFVVVVGLLWIRGFFKSKSGGVWKNSMAMAFDIIHIVISSTRLESLWNLFQCNLFWLIPDTAHSKGVMHCNL